MKIGPLVLFAPLLLAAPAAAAEIAIEGVRMSRDFACAEGQDVVVSGADNQVSLTGRCGVVKLLGSGHGLSFETADELVVSGISIEARGRAVGSLVVEVAKNRVARIAVVRVSRLAEPRAVMNWLEPPPMPKAPPSERCSRITAISAMTISK